MKALYEYNAYIKGIHVKANHNKQYTVRNLSPQLDEKLRQRSRQMKKSLNEVVLETLSRGVGLGDAPLIHHDLDHLAGTWKDDPEFERAIEMQNRIDPKMWS